MVTTKSAKDDRLGLVDTSGRPLSSNLNRNGYGAAATDPESVRKGFGSSISSYIESLGRLDMPPIIRARDPFQNHAWVSAAAIAVAFVSSQAPFLVYEETDRATEERRLKTKASGRPWTGPPAGSRRRAVERYLRRSYVSRFLWTGKGKSAEQNLDHPLMGVLSDPNPLQNGSQLMQLTLLWLAIRGEFAWLPTNDAGEPTAIGEEPAQLWPIPPDCVEPQYRGGLERGDLIGWWVTPPNYLPSALQRGRRFRVEVGELIQFKFPDPNNPMRGLSRLTAAASAIESDLYARGHNRAILKNQGRPAGIIEVEGVITPTEQKDFEQTWKERQEKLENRGSTAMLPYGMKWKQQGFSPAELEYLAGMKFNREEILALLGTHKSLLGVTEDINYATLVGATANFWQMTIIPNQQIVEQTLDRTLFYPQTDNVFGMFDVTSVDALRVGLGEKIKQANELCGQNLHMTPRAAYITVGLDAPEYDGDEVAFVTPLATTVESAIAASNEPDPVPAPPPTAVPPAVEEDPPKEEDAKSAAPHQRAAAPSVRTSKGTAAQRRRRWLQFVRMQGKLEADMGRRYRAWVRAERAETLDRFDAEAARPGTRAAALRPGILLKELRLSAVLPDPEKSGKKLKEKTRPNRAASLDATYKFTLDELGIPTFAIDDAAIMRHFDLREKIFAGKVPVTLRDNLFSSLQAGIQNGETVQQLRSRIAEAYDIAAGSSKTLMVARTETASFMNGIRDEMFGLQGLDSLQWVSAGDEHVRTNHVTYGASGAKPKGFDYLTLVGLGGSGALRYPGDSDAPAGEVVNCRCLSVPA